MALVMVFGLLGLLLEHVFCLDITGPAFSKRPDTPPEKAPLPEFTTEERCALWRQRVLRKEEFSQTVQSVAGGSEVSELTWEQREQIVNDLHRSGVEEKVRPVLERILRRVAMRDPIVGYVQGMNYIVSTLFKICEENKTEDFGYAGLVHILDEVAIQYYSPGFPGMLRDVAIMKATLRLCGAEFSEDVLDVLSTGVLLSMGQSRVSSASFDTRPLRMEDLIRLWDAILIYGRPGLIAMSLALMGASCGAGNAHFRDIAETGKKMDNPIVLTVIVGTIEDLLPKVLSAEKNLGTSIAEI